MAVMQTHTIADAMRAARTTATANGFDVGLDEDIDEVEGGTAYATAALRAWRTGLTENLGEDATGAVECDGAVCDITIQWRDRQVRPAEGDPEGEEAEADEALQQLTTTVRL